MSYLANKKASVFILFLFAVMVTACNKDDDPMENPLAAELIGKWNINYVEISGCTDLPELNQVFDLTSSNCFTEEGDEVCLESYLEFMDNGQRLYFFESVTTTPSGVVTTETNEDTRGYTLEGNTLKTCKGEGELVFECTEYQISIAGDQLTMVSSSIGSEGCTEEIRAVRE